MTNLYLARPSSLRAHSLSAAVGSGKTRAAVAYMARPSTAARNFIYVAPTIALVKQTTANLRQALAVEPGTVVRNINLIHSQNTDGTEAQALRSINEVQGDEGSVHILTTPTFLAILSHIKRPELWSVLLDEAFEPARFIPFHLGEDAADGWGYFGSLFATAADQGHRIHPREGKKALVDDVAAGRFDRAGVKYAGCRDMADAVANPAMRCELLVTDKVASLMRGEVPTTRKSSKAKKDPETSTMEAACYVAPEYFAGFREVIFLCALFEQTVLYHLWTRALGVTFERHPDFPADMLRDVHAEQGRFLAVGHLLHPADASSKENLGRNLLTGETGEKEHGQRVLDHLIRTASEYFGERRFLLQTNNRTGYDEGSTRIPGNAVKIPSYPHGRNDFDHVDNVLALCITNPKPQQLAWVRSRTGLSSSEVTQSYRVHTLYQALGRCSIRKAVPTTDPKVFLTAGEPDARFILSLFPGALWLGQVGDLSSLRKLTDAPAKALGKTAQLAQDIRAYLSALSPEVIRIGSKTVKAGLQVTNRTTTAIGAEGELVIPAQTWTAAVDQVVGAGSGWRREGGSLVRVAAADYGFEDRT